MTTLTAEPAAYYRCTFEGYERRRAELRKWLTANYVLAFDLEPGRLLDVGCGEGFWGSLFAELGYSVCGLDPSADFIAAGREKYPDITLKVGVAEEPPFESEFDVIFCRTLPHFYAPDLRPARPMVEALTSLLSPSGTLLISVYSDLSGSARASLGGKPHWHHTLEALTRTIESAGVTIWRTLSHGKYVQFGCSR